MASKVAEDLWARWFDESKTSIEKALGFFRIDTEPDLDSDDAEIVPYVPFRLREKQHSTLERIQDKFWRRDRRAAKLVVLKCRRYGMSTFFLLLGLERLLRVPGYQCLLVAQDDTMARKHFQKLRDAFKQIPEFALEAQGIEIVKDTDQQLILRRGFKSSEFHVAPAKRNALGRGARYNALFLTEVPIWPRTALRDLSGLLAACRNVRGNIVVFESTANGYDAIFYRRFHRATKRRSDYRPIFIAAYEHPGNRKRFPTPEAEKAFIETIGKDREYGIEDEQVLWHRLRTELHWPDSEAAAFLNWRRYDIMDVCEGVVDYHRRENPNTPAEAFQGTGLPIFRKDILEAWRPEAEKREAQAKRVTLVQRSDLVQAIDALSSELCVYEWPEQGRRYVFGSDVASGIQQHADGKTEADFSVTIIGEEASGNVVARFRAQLPEGEFGKVNFLLACWYGGARGYIERAINGSGVAIESFEGQELGDYSGMSLLLSQKQDIRSDYTSQRANVKWHPGFKTTSKTKPRLVENIRLFVSGMGVPDGERTSPIDLMTLDEGMKFERSPSTGKMEASTGHDDCVIAFGLMLEARRHLAEYGSGEERPALPSGHREREGKMTGDEILLHYARVRGPHLEEEQDSPNAVDGMPGY